MMKFLITIATQNSDSKSFVDMEGTLDSAKTYIKLAANDHFNWAAIRRIDDMVPGDVEYWRVSRNRTTMELTVRPFAFYKVDAELNLNMIRVGLHDPAAANLDPICKLLGGGKF